MVMRSSRLSDAVAAAGVPPDTARAVVLNAQPGEAHGDFARAVTTVQWHAGLAETIRADLADPEQPEGAFDLAIVHHTRNRVETLGLVARAVSLARGGTVIVDGAKADGVEGTMRQVSQAVGLSGRVSRSHGKAFWFAADDLAPDITNAWQAAASAGPNEQGFVTAPGMFSHDAADPASEMLATCFAGRLSGRCADLGAGWGLLAARAFDAGAERVELFESDHRALAAARANLAGRNCEFHWCDVTTLQGSADFDHVITNPPFHEGARADPALGHAFIAAARGMVSPRGTLWLVANRHLPYESALEAAFGQVERVAMDGRFKAFAARNPKPDTPKRRRRR